MERGLPKRLVVSPSLMAAEEELNLATGFHSSYGVGGSHQLALKPVPVSVSDCLGYLSGEIAGKKHHLSSIDSGLKLKAPKHEAGGGSIARLSSKGGSSDFLRLPDLRSPDLEPPLCSIESSHNRFQSPPRHSSSAPPPPSNQPSYGVGKAGNKMVVPGSEIARRRRQRISDRTRILAGLMPWSKPMDTATMLEEARKYVRFLEAQVTALQSMPHSASGFALPQPAGAPEGGLEGLSRQQLLRVLVGSAPVQDMLYRNGLCAFSAEQAAALARALEQRPQLLMLLEGSSSSG